MSSLFILFIGCVVRMSTTEPLTIDNQLTVIRSDCYDRLAIGHRLNPKDIYKTLHNLTTVRDCQLACTQEKDVCKALSFGIGVKGNATCELGLAQIKETGDLKPIGTIMENDFDLYIKKLGCTLAIEKKPHIKPLGLFQDTLSPSSPTQYSSEENPKNGKPPNYLPKPPKQRPSDKNTQDTANSYQQRLPQYEKPQEIPKRPVNSYENAHLVDKPSYIPEMPKNGYDRPQNGQINQPQSDYYRPHRPEYHNNRPSDYDQEHHERPQIIYNKYDHGLTNQDRPSFIPGRPKPSDGYGDLEDEINRPNAIPNRPRPLPEYGQQGDEYDRPQAIPSRPVPEYDYGSHENEYNRPNKTPNRPRPHIEYNNQDDGYNRPQNIPARPTSQDEYGNHDIEYNRPGFNPNKPSPQNEYSGQHGDYDRPQSIPGRPASADEYENPGPVYDRPDSIPSRPRPQNDYGSSHDAYDRPNRIPSRPQTGWSSLNDYGGPERPKPGYGSGENGYDNLSPSRPHTSYDLPEKPQNDYDKLTYQYGKPGKLSDKPGGGYDRPSKPDEETHQVQHVVSIASGPYPLSLHPVHNILVGTDSYRYGYPHTKPTYDREYHDHTKPTRQKPGYKEEFLPPFRPLHLKHPYNDFDDYENLDSHRPRPYDYPTKGDTNSNWERSPNHRPDFDGDDTDNYHPIDWRSDRDRLQSRPYYGPYPEKYASYIPHPDEYDRRRPLEDEFYGPDIDRYDGGRRPFHRQPLYGQHYRRLYAEKPRPNSHIHNKENLRYNDTSTNETVADEQTSNKTTPSLDNSNSASANEDQPETQLPNSDRNKGNQASNSSKPIVTQTVLPNGETITSIITEIDQIESSPRHRH